MSAPARSRRPLRTATLLAAGLLAAVAPAAAQEQSTRDIVTQPARDVGIGKTEIPPLLVEASAAPYATEGVATCAQIAAAIADLNAVVGPDFSTSPTKNKTNVAKVGGAAVINSLIPFRGVVREVSGAGAAERRKNAAIDAGIARRGFLRGLQSARRCRR